MAIGKPVLIKIFLTKVEPIMLKNIPKIPEMTVAIYGEKSIFINKK